MADVAGLELPSYNKVKAWRCVKRTGVTRLAGRCRVGKSELILQFGKNRPTLCLVGKRAPAEQRIP
jgi:hypothetical protein